MAQIPTLHIAEHQRFTQSDIESCLKQFYKKQDSKNTKSNGDRESSQESLDSKAKEKAQKIFADLQEFAKQKGNGSFLRFWGSNTLKAQNHVGLIQTKSGFCVEILPKTFDGNGFDTESQKCKIHKENNDKSHKASLNKQTFATQVGEFIKSLTTGRHSEAIAEESKLTESTRDSSSATQTQNDKNNTKPNSTESNDKDSKDDTQCPTCQIHHAKQILLNCLATLKDSPFKQSHIASLQSLNLPLLEVFIQMFLAELERLIHRGLKSDYVQIAQNRAFLKGKLLFNEQIKHNLIHKERFFTQSDEYSLNSAPNRLIKRTLEFLRTFSLSPKTRTKLDSLYFIFEEITPSSHIERDFAKCKNMRRFKEYELVLLWCAIFLRQRSFSAYSGSERAFALLFPMERLFESFVGYWCKRVACDYEVKMQESSKYLIAESKEAIDKSGGLFALKPDMVMRGRGKSNDEIIILDTKWKIPDSTNDEKRYGIAQSDVYQMWAYASKYAKKESRKESNQQSYQQQNTESKKVSVWLIYPLCERTEALKKEWAESNKKWYFKASKDLDNPIGIALSFFPLYEQNP